MIFAYKGIAAAIVTISSSLHVRASTCHNPSSSTSSAAVAISEKDTNNTTGEGIEVDFFFFKPLDFFFKDMLKKQLVELQQQTTFTQTLLNQAFYSMIS